MSHFNHPTDFRSGIHLNQIDPILRLPDLMQAKRLGRSTIYKLIAEGQLEPPLKISARVVGWRASAVRAFIESRQGRA